MKNFVFMAVLLVIAACVQAGLNSPAVINPSFENPELDAEAKVNDIVDWWDAAQYVYTQDDALAKLPETPYGDNWAEFGNERWMYQQIGTYEENMQLDVTFLLGQKSDKPFQGVHVSILVGGDAALAADVNSKYYTANPLETVVGAFEIANSGAINPFASDGLAMSEQALSFSTGTGYTVGDPLWIQFNKVAGTGRILIDNVNVELPTKPILVGPDNGEPRADINAYLEWSAPPIGLVDHYVLYYRNDPNFLAPTGTTVVDPATSPHEMGTMPYNTPYYWRVDAVAEPNDVTGNVWNFTTIPEIPEIETQPEGDLVAGDGTASAQFTLAGLNIVNYKWHKDGEPLEDDGRILGSDTITLTVSNVTIEDEGMYSCVVDNDKEDFDETTSALLMTERLVAHFEFENNLSDTQLTLETGVVVDPNTAEGTTDMPDVGYGTGIIGIGALELAANEGVAGYEVGFVEIPNIGSKLNFHPLGMSISAWVKVTESSYYMSTIAEARDDDAGTSAFLFNRYYGRGRWKNDGNTVTDSLTETADIRDGQWHLVTGTFDGVTGEQKIYIDGLYDNINTGILDKTVFSNTSVLRIGAQRIDDNGNVVRAFKGLIDDVKIYSYPIDPVDVAKLYYAGTGESTCIDSEGLEFDLAGGGPDGTEPDCIVNLADFAVFVNDHWLNCRLVPNCFN